MSDHQKAFFTFLVDHFQLFAHHINDKLLQHYSKLVASFSSWSVQEAGKLADAIAASEEHVEELKARITARQDWMTREQQSVDAKIEEATRPVASQRTEAAQQHSSFQEQVEDLRYSSKWYLV